MLEMVKIITSHVTLKMERSTGITFINRVPMDLMKRKTFVSIQIMRFMSLVTQMFRELLMIILQFASTRWEMKFGQKDLTALHPTVIKCRPLKLMDLGIYL